MYLKTVRIHLKDIFTEIREEKQKLLKEIELLKDFRNCLNSFVDCCKCDQNVINGNKFIANQLENQYLTSLAINLVINKPNVDTIPVQKEIKVIDISHEDNDRSDRPIVDFVEDEVIINENTLDIDFRQFSDDEKVADFECRQLSDNSVVKEIQLEVIPKKEAIVLPPEEPPIEVIYDNSHHLMNGNKNIFNAEELVNHSIGTDPNLGDNRFSYLTSFVSQIKNCDQITSNSIENFNANNSKQHFGKTIVVEKNKKIIGFVCNIENCTEFYKSITGLQSHIDRVHNKCESVAKSVTTGKELNSSKTSVKNSSNSPKSVPKKYKTNVRQSDITIISQTNAETEPTVEENSKTNDIKTKSKLICGEPNCRFSCGTKYQLLSHKISKHKIGRHFRCKRPDCGRTFNSKFDVIQHLRMHSIKSSKNSTVKQSELPFECLFKECKLTFDKMSQLIDHKINSNHNEMGDKLDKSFLCPTKRCGRSFKSKFALRIHMGHSKHRHPHNKVNQLIPESAQNKPGKYEFKCAFDNCGRTFKSRFALKKHSQRSDHKSLLLTNGLFNIFSTDPDYKQRVFNCSNIDCKEEFKHRFALNQHLKSCEHKGNPPSIPPSVPLLKPSLNPLTTKRMRKGKKFKCEITGCNDMFTHYYSLKNHIKSIHLLPPLKCRVKECTVRFNTCAQKILHYNTVHIK